MLDEYNALISNGTWALVPRPANVNVVRSMWLFKHKFYADGSLRRYKARLVANGRKYIGKFDDASHMQIINRAGTTVGYKSPMLSVRNGDPCRDPTIIFAALLVFLYLPLPAQDLYYAESNSLCFYLLLQLTAYTDDDWVTLSRSSVMLIYEV
ncbi:ribonuclease H-like domain-containing protein [Tanacetum coccineum]